MNLLLFFVVFYECLMNFLGVYLELLIKEFGVFYRLRMSDKYGFMEEF